MTGIIYDGKTIAADQLVVERNYTVQAYRPKLEKWSRGYVATAGRVTDGIVFKEWLEQSRAPKPPQVDKLFEAIYTEDGIVYYIDSDLVPVEAPIPSGCGSCGEILEILVRSGLTGEKALKAALKFRTDIGGKVDVVKVIKQVE